MKVPVNPLPLEGVTPLTDRGGGIKVTTVLAVLLELFGSVAVMVTEQLKPTPLSWAPQRSGWL